MKITTSGPILALRALVMFVRLDIAFRRSDFHTIYDDVTRKAQRMRSSPATAETSAIVRRTVEAVRTATRYYYRSRKDCLPKAFTIFHLLRAQGVSATLVIGVKKYPFGAHSWVEHEGEALDESVREVTSYTVLARA